jgi:hypothetical protein
VKAFLALVLALATGAGLVGLGEATRDPDRPAVEVARVPEQVPVVAASVVCPDVRQVNGTVASRVSAGAAGSGAGTGTLAVATLGDPSSVLPLTRSGTALTDLGLGVPTDALEVEATGDLAPGLEVESITRGSQGGPRGLAGTRCDAAGVEHWFVGGGTRVGETSVLVLANPDPQQALVDVAVFGEAAAADEAPGRGLVVPGGGRLLVALNDLAPDLSSLTVHVEARRGRVAAGVLTSRVSGRIAQGLEWAPAAQPPAVRAVVPGLVQGPGTRRVLVSNPGDVATTVSLDLTTTDGQDSPPDLAEIAVPARRVVAIDLSEQVAAGSAAVTVRSAGGPVLAVGLVVDTRGGPVADFALAGSATPLTRVAMLSDLTLAPSIESTLVLSAVDAGATVRVTAVPVAGGTSAVRGPQTLRVPGGSTRELKLSSFVAPGATARLVVQVEVLEGAVYAARHLRENGADGPLTTSLALRSARDLVQRPQVAADAGAGRFLR